ncbi:TRAP transporter small permease subunit [Chelativorans intermedius]|uniref:TRAP transporter small permease protein n=1 Tax=Chelativorans intermedius TaxID=515947 RepID=A0ABV6D4D1_9HYPH|nr:TRAP transporter small permease subunit [Chelativorans intermedius]MCT8997604.1 TRAP transporter small permease subunit [Chelativorans intermedius]
MPEIVRRYVRLIDRVNRVVGLFAMYLVVAMIGILLYSSVMKAVAIPPLWTLEMAQFVMAAYYMLGGGWSLQHDSHVRMDLIYANWGPRTRAMVDSVTILFLIFYLCILLYGGFSSTAYALRYGETSYSAWSPYMAPIKIVMCIGVALMLLQAIAQFFRDLALARGEELS